MLDHLLISHSFVPAVKYDRLIDTNKKDNVKVLTDDCLLTQQTDSLAGG